MAIVTAQITVPEAIAPLIEDAATEQSQSVSAYLSEAIDRGQSLQGIANDRSQQAWWRLQQSGNIPAEVISESRRHALANAPKPEQVAE